MNFKVLKTNVKLLCLLVLIVMLVDSTNGFSALSEIRLGRRMNWTWPMIETAVKNIVDSYVSKNILDLRKVVSETNLTSPCEEALFNVFFGLRNSETWAIEMFDATGKFPSGILRGTVMDLGSFEECLDLRVNASRHEELFRGKYCMVGYHTPLFSPLTKPSQIFAYVDAHGKPPDYILEPMKKAGNYMKNMGFWFGTCVPSTCTEHDIEKIANAIAEPFGFHATVADCQVEKFHIHWKNHEIISVSVIGVIGAIIFIGTFIDIVSRYSSEDTDAREKSYSQESWALRCCKLFSISYNTERLMKTTSGHLTLFNGIRFFSATWIILGHTYFYENRWQFLKYRHLIGVYEKFNKFLPAAVIDNFTIPVGSFFFMSGFLQTYTNWTKLERKDGSFNSVRFLIHKFFRITPSLLMTIVMLMGLPLIGSGPLWYSTLGPEIYKCQNNWWKNLLFISNFWDVDDICLLHTWYLAALMQFHVIALILLLIGNRWQYLGSFLGLLILAACTTLTALKMVWFDFPMPAPGLTRDFEIIHDYTSKVYIKPFAHFGSFFIGMAFGFILLKYREVKMAGVYSITGWLLAISCGLLTVYGIYGPAHHYEARAVYISLHRIGWALALGWVTLVCASGSGGFINRFLSWKAFQPLGHLSYNAYLLHPLVIIYREGSLRERVYYGHNELVFAFISNVVVSYFLAYICFIMIELPFSSLEVMLCNVVNKARKSYRTKDCNISTITGCTLNSVKPSREK